MWIQKFVELFEKLFKCDMEIRKTKMFNILRYEVRVLIQLLSNLREFQFIRFGFVPTSGLVRVDFVVEMNEKGETLSEISGYLDLVSRIRHMTSSLECTQVVDYQNDDVHLDDFEHELRTQNFFGIFAQIEFEASLFQRNGSFGWRKKVYSPRTIQFV